MTAREGLPGNVTLHISDLKMNTASVPLAYLHTTIKRTPQFTEPDGKSQFDL